MRWTLYDGADEVAAMTDAPTAMTAEGTIRGATWSLSRSGSHRHLEARGPSEEYAEASVGWLRGGEIQLADGTVLRLTRWSGRWWKLVGPSGLVLKQRRVGWVRTVEVWTADGLVDRHPDAILLGLYAMVTRPRWY